MSENQAATKLQAAYRGKKARENMVARRLKAKRKTACGLFCSKVDKLPLIHPSSRYKLAWDVISMLFLVYNIIVVPYRIAWDSNATLTSKWFLVESVIDWFFVADILLNFRTCVTDPRTMELSKDSYVIAREYGKSWFLIDFVSSCPIDFFVMTMGDPEGGSVKMLKLFRILRLSKLLKLVKILKVQSVFEELQDYYYVSDTYKKVLSMLSITIYLAHMLACFWMFTTRNDPNGWYRNEERFYARASPIDPVTGNQHTVEDGFDPGKYEEYVWCVYWALTTMSTVGYGDITPATEREAICTMVAMMLGSGVFGYVLGNVSDIVATDSVSARTQEKLHAVNSYMRSRNLPITLQVRIRKFFRYMLKRKSVFDERGILEELSLTLRYEVTEFLNKDVIQRMPLLHHLDPACTNMIVENLNPVFYSAKEILFHEGDVGLEMFFLCNGMVDLLVTTVAPFGGEQQEHKVRRMVPGDYFAELPLLALAVGGGEEERWGGEESQVGEVAAAASDGSASDGSFMDNVGNSMRRGSFMDNVGEAMHHVATMAEMAIENDSRLRLATGRAHTICDLYSLRKEALDLVFDAFPNFATDLEAEGEERRSFLIKIRHLCSQKAQDARLEKTKEAEASNLRRQDAKITPVSPGDGSSPRRARSSSFQEGSPGGSGRSLVKGGSGKGGSSKGSSSPPTKAGVSMHDNMVANKGMSKYESMKGSDMATTKKKLAQVKKQASAHWGKMGGMGGMAAKMTSLKKVKIKSAVKLRDGATRQSMPASAVNGQIKAQMEAATSQRTASADVTSMSEAEQLFTPPRPGQAGSSSSGAITTAQGPQGLVQGMSSADQGSAAPPSIASGAKSWKAGMTKVGHVVRSRPMPTLRRPGSGYRRNTGGRRSVVPGMVGSVASMGLSVFSEAGSMIRNNTRGQLHSRSVDRNGRGSVDRTHRGSVDRNGRGAEPPAGAMLEMWEQQQAVVVQQQESMTMLTMMVQAMQQQQLAMQAQISQIAAAVVTTPPSSSLTPGGPTEVTVTPPTAAATPVTKIFTANGVFSPAVVSGRSSPSSPVLEPIEQQLGSSGLPTAALESGPALSSGPPTSMVGPPISSLTSPQGKGNSAYR
jgi:CRP-like cAMP-binding protein